MYIWNNHDILIEKFYVYFYEKMQIYRIKAFLLQ